MIKELAPPSIKELLVDIFDTSFEEIKDHIIKVLILPRIDEIEDERLLDLLAWQFHIEGWELARTIQEKRNLIKHAIELHRYKGTPHAIKKVFEVLNLQAELLEWFEYGGEPYKFKVSLTSEDRELTSEVLQKLRELIEEYKNVRSWLEEIEVSYLTKQSFYVSSSALYELSADTEMMPYEFDVQSTGFVSSAALYELTMYANN